MIGLLKLTPARSEKFSVYVVDDTPQLAELYTALLENKGCVVKSFTDRAEAVAAMVAEKKKPDLLITDYSGRSLPVESFMHQCRRIHPGLRILMASGFGRTHLRFSHTEPNRFLQKPFTVEEFQQEVDDVLAA
jgi:DNA-binding NtrC family response regulator